nr:uncharacterized protein LOC117276070 [Nicotiana tomentosiformis]
MSVDEYFKAMDMAMIQANCMEEEEATMARFLNGLNREIADVVELQQYVTLDELVELAIKVERQNKRRQQSSSWRSRPTTIPKKQWPKSEETPTLKFHEDKGRSKLESKDGGKPFTPKTSTSTSSIQCLKCQGRGHKAYECPSRRNILIKEDGGYESEKGEPSEEQEENFVESEEGEEMEYIDSGVNFLVRRPMHINLGHSNEEQRENIFHTRYELVELAVKVEGQNKRRQQSSSWRSRPTTIPKKQWPKSEETPTLKFHEDKGMSKLESKDGGKPFTPKTSTSTSSIQCLKCQGRGHKAYECPSRRNILIKEDGGYESEKGEPSEEQEENFVENEEGEEMEYIDSGVNFLVRRPMHINLGHSNEEQRENIFHTRCEIKDKICSMIIDNGSCANVVSAYLVEKLGFEWTKHPRPYRLQWFNDSGEVKVNKKCMVSFKIGRYADEVLCDIVPMQACHLLLGRPWQYDRSAFHDGRKNRYSLEHNGKKYILAPLTPSQVYEDQKKMKESMGKHGEGSKRETERKDKEEKY